MCIILKFKFMNRQLWLSSWCTYKVLLEMHIRLFNTRWNLKKRIKQGTAFAASHSLTLKLVNSSHRVWSHVPQLSQNKWIQASIWNLGVSRLANCCLTRTAVWHCFFWSEYCMTGRYHLPCILWHTLNRHKLQLCQTCGQIRRNLRQGTAIKS